MKSKSKYFDAFYQSLSVSGEKGTLKNMFKNSPVKGKIHAKSGMIDGVRAYVGYLTTKSGRELAFAMNINNFSCKSSEAKRKLKALMTALVEFDE